MQAPVTWSGTFTNTQEVVHGLLSQDRWYKTFRIILDIISIELEVIEEVNQARIYSIRGFFFYVAKTYKDMNTYLKGLYITIDIWRGRAIAGEIVDIFRTLW